MEIMDVIDKMTAIYGDEMDSIPPYIGGGHSGRTLRINRTEEVRGSNPLRSTHKPPGMGVSLCLILQVGVLFRYVRFLEEIGGIGLKSSI
jgi:hypothetical protein